MALRSHPRTPSATSGPGRAPSSDGRIRHRHRRRPVRARQGHHRSADELRRRAEALFVQRPAQRREVGAGPPRAVERGSPPTWPKEAVEEEEPAPDGETGGEAAGAVPAARGDGHGLRGRAGLALRERMPVWLQARCGLERRSVAALAVVLVVAAGLAVQHFWSGRTQPVRAPEIVRAAGSYEEQQPGEATGPGSPPVSAPVEGSDGASAVGAAGAPAEIVVDVSGKVREPGVHRLPAGSRVADALRAAGGVRPGTNVDGLNRARFLMDGEQVIVGGPAVAGTGTAIVPGSGSASGSGPGSGGTVGGVPPGSGALAGPMAPVSLTTATIEQLDGLPGVGPVLAQHIVDYRTQHGGFRSVDELREVNGIGERRFADLRDLVRP
ncbi:helix-hairpin-helix domain-containing protein [Streptomyces sp. NPDC053367]|uniref:helix-hairpin-helix domain-containing protein n=1 Tax=Streptomyces sp. NPDC053367 TaxID=3365700 RepID=UPI0037D58E49